MNSWIRLSLLATLSLVIVNCQSKLQSGASDQQSQSPAPSPNPNPAPSPSPNPANLNITGSAANVSVVPGGTASVTLNISAAQSGPITVTYTTADDTAVSGTYYLATQGSATIASGATSVSVSVPTTNTAALDFANKRFKVLFTFPGTAVPVVSAFVSFNAASAKSTGMIGQGYYHSCSIKNGAAYCFGIGSSGELGNGATGNTNLPQLVAGLDSGVTDIAAAQSYACAIKAGKLYCWGTNDNYQLGDGSITPSTFPKPVYSLDSAVTAVSAGYQHACAIKAGALYCWGYNAYAQVGHNNGAQQVPYRVLGFETGVTSVAAGYLHTCAVKNAALFCWGYNGQGELGIGNFTINNLRNPAAGALAAIVGLDANVASVSSGGQTTCALKTSGSLYCWGYNGYGQLGLGSTAGNASPQLINGFDANVSAVSTSQDHTCAIKAGSVYCWGANNYGQLGYNDTVARTAPNAVPVTITLAAGETFVAISTSANLTTGYVSSSCGRTSNNRVLCWGYNGYGQTGVSAATGSVLIPTAVPFFN